METTASGGTTTEPNPWIGMPVLDQPTASATPAPAPAAAVVSPSSGAETAVAESADAVKAAASDDTAALRRRVVMRTRRLVIANVAALATSAVAVVLLFGTWWTFSISDTTLSIPQVGGGFTTVPIKGASAVLPGVEAGGITVVALMVTAAVVAAVASWKRWWPLAAVSLVMLAPAGPGVPPVAPPPSVATPQSLGAQLTEAGDALRTLRVIWWVELLLLVAIAIQGFVVWRAHRAVSKAEHPEEGSFMARSLDRFVTASLARVGVEVAQQLRDSDTNSTKGAKTKA
jgi:hypothetical protein